MRKLFLLSQNDPGSMSKYTYVQKSIRFSCPVMGALARVTGFPRLLRGKATRKGRPGDREGNRGALTFSIQCRVATWNCGGLSRAPWRRRPVEHVTFQVSWSHAIGRWRVSISRELEGLHWRPSSSGEPPHHKRMDQISESKKGDD